MVNLSRYFGIIGTVICCIIWIFCPAESEMISKKVGEDVTLSCTNESVTLLLWKLNGENLFSVRGKANNSIVPTDIAKRLDINILDTKSQLYALTIKNTKKSHEGNYTCDVTGDFGQFENSWELIVTGEAESFLQVSISIAVGVLCACLMIIILVLIIFKCQQKWKQHNVHPPASIRQQPGDDIYENHLEIKRQAQACQCKPRSQ